MNIKKQNNGIVSMENTFDKMSWIQEEDFLIQMESIPEKKPLTQIEVRFLFVDPDMYVKRIPSHMVELDISGNVSILSNASLMEEIEIAKREYIEMYASSGIFSFMDLLIWNVEMEHEHIRQYIKNGFSNAFVNASLNSNIVLKPSLPAFHSTQSIFVIFRECKDSKPDTTKSTTKSTAKQTKRVRFQLQSGKGTRCKHMRIITKPIRVDN